MKKLSLLKSALLSFLLLSGCTNSDINVYNSTPIDNGQTSTGTIIQDSQNISEESNFKIRFLDVGQADAALIECDNHYMLIDGGNKEDSNLIYSVLKSEQVEKLDIVVGTHAHEDHIGGIPGAFNYTTADITLCPVTDYDSKAFKDFKKYADEKGGGIVIPQVGDNYELGSALIRIIGVNSGEDTNDTSIVLKIEYGDTSFLFTGDAERETEQIILDSGVDIESTVLKVGHHGSTTSTTYPFLREIMPKYAIISAGVGNKYGHPNEETLSRLHDAGAKVFRTDLQGEVVVTSNGKEVTVIVERNENIDTFSTEKVQNVKPNKSQHEKTENNLQKYVRNKSTMKFHFPECKSAKNISEKNKIVYKENRDEIIKKGYSPCESCNP